MAMIFYRFKGMVILKNDYSFDKRYRNHQINDGAFLTLFKTHPNENKLGIIFDIIPNFCNLILLNLENYNYDFSMVALTSDQVLEDQIMYLILKGINIEISKELSFDN